MNPLKIKSYLEVITNVAVLLVATVILSAFAANLFISNKRQLISGLQRALPLPQIPGLDYKSAPRTLILALSPKCVYCDESIPFYKSLVEARRERGIATKLVAVFPNSQSEVNEYVRQKQLRLDAIAGVDFKSINVAVTPTLILVDSSGQVIDFWIGKLSKEGEQELIKSFNL